MQFLLLTAAVVLIALIDLRRIDSVVSLPAYLATVAGLLVWAVALYRHGDRRSWLDIGGPILVACLGVAAGDYQWSFAAMYGALFLHGTYGGAARSARTVVMYIAAYETAVAVTRGVDAIGSGIVSHAIGVSVVGYLVRTIASSVRRHDAARQREEVLTSASGQLLTANDPDDVARLALEAVAAVTADAARPHRVTLWHKRGDVLEMSALTGTELTVDRLALEDVPTDLRAAYLDGGLVRLGPERMAALQRSMGAEVEFDHGLSVPLVEDGHLNGLLFVATTEPLAHDTLAALERFMHEVSLADVLVRRQAILRGVVDNSADAILLVGRDDVIEFASTSVTQLTGREAATLVGRPVAELLFRRYDDTFVGVSGITEAAVGDHDLFAGQTDDARHVEIAIGAVHQGATVVNLRDVTERRRLEDEVTYRAFHDPVTGLANRSLFNDRVDHALARAERDNAHLAVALIDLDDFKAINDVHGHSEGDRLLVQIAQRLTSAVRRSDTCARFGGDEFAVLMEDATGDDIDVVLSRIADALAQPFDVGEHHVAISASIGLRHGHANESADTLVGDADVAMYVAKAQGKNQLVHFQDGMRLAALQRLELKSELQAAIDNDQLVLHYQPIIELKTGQTHGFEALVRWDHPTRGLVPPDVFIPVAEDTGLIVPLGRWVLLQACTQLAAWQTAGLTHQEMRISVNLSPHQLLDPELVDHVIAVIDQTGIRPQQLELEVTETALMGEPERAGEILTALSSLGIVVAIDDFGTGYSSFAYLQRFPVDVIKVDRSFVSRITDGPEQAALAHAIIKLAQTLNMATVAEGVEEPAQEDVLNSWGCTHGQGWRWARAMPTED
ncbi:MAG: EAL domain-containing protein, partial [Actinobacteria bacterium]|nr:EAL domain-containing protein [Actinomycetota bacterium]